MKVLVTGGGAPGAAGIISCLKKAGNFQVFCCDVRDRVPGQALADGFFQIRPASDPDFADHLLAACLSHGIRVLIPIVTRELEILAVRKADFATNGIIVLVNDAQTLQLSNNKFRVLQAAEAAGLQIPEFREVNCVDELHAAAIALGYPYRKLVLRPCHSNGSRGLRFIDSNPDNTAALYDVKPGSASFTLEQLCSQLSEIDFRPSVLTRFLPGTEYSADCLFQQGEALLVIPRSRTKMTEGISTAGVFENHLAIREYCSALGRALKLHGNAGIQLKLDEQNQPRLIEVNPRLQGTVSAALGLGVNLPALGVALELNGHADVPSAGQLAWGTSFARHYSEIFFPPDVHS